MSDPTAKPAPTFWLKNAKISLCVVRLRSGLPCTAKVKYACATCDRHAKYEDAATEALKAAHEVDSEGTP
jgi:hypothetical protein